MLPNCIIIGVAKSGTTALYRYLSEHPQIFMSRIKEVKYFAYEEGVERLSSVAGSKGDEFQVKTLQEYEDLFADAGNFPVRGEASPRYFGSPIAARNIRNTIPDAKLIASLRNPVDRAYSGYLMHLRNGRVKGRIEDAFTRDAHYVKVSFYYEKLKRYFDLFPRDQLKIILYDELKKDTLATVQGIFEYLGVDPGFEPNVSARHNVGTVPKNDILHGLLMKNSRIRKIVEPITPEFMRRAVGRLYKKNLTAPPKMPEEIRSTLAEYFRDDILKVQDLIQKDLSEWLQAS